MYDNSHTSMKAETTSNSNGGNALKYISKSVDMIIWYLSEKTRVIMGCKISKNAGGGRWPSDKGHEEAQIQKAFFIYVSTRKVYVLFAYKKIVIAES